MPRTLIPKRPPPRRAVNATASTPSDDAAQSLSVRRRYTRVGRIILWSALGLMLVVVVVNGVQTIARGPQSPGTRAAAASAFPGDEARVFAQRFAQVYLTYSPATAEAQTAAINELVAPALRAADAVIETPSGPAQRVADAWVARSERVDRARALMTVACVVVAQHKSSVVYLAVPVATDRRGGLVIYDYPSLVSPPRVASEVPDDTDRALDGPAGDAIEALLTRFLPEYLAGGAVAPEFLAPGASVAPLGHRYVFVELVSLAQTGVGSPRTRRVLAIVRARDTVTNAVYTLRYRLRVALSDRWLVNHIEG